MVPPTNRLSHSRGTEKPIGYARWLDVESSHRRGAPRCPEEDGGGMGSAPSLCTPSYSSIRRLKDTCRPCYTTVARQPEASRTHAPVRKLGGRYLQGEGVAPESLTTWLCFPHDRIHFPLGQETKAADIPFLNRPLLSFERRFQLSQPTPKVLWRSIAERQ